MTEIGMMLRDSAWREVQWKWEVETLEPLKLGDACKGCWFMGVEIGAWM